jgi:hypothetical protein
MMGGGGACAVQVPSTAVWTQSERACAVLVPSIAVRCIGALSYTQPNSNK